MSNFKSNFIQFYFLLIPAFIGGISIGVSLAAVSWVLQNITEKTSFVSLNLSISGLISVLLMVRADLSEV